MAADGLPGLRGRRAQHGPAHERAARRARARPGAGPVTARRTGRGPSQICPEVTCSRTGTGRLATVTMPRLEEGASIAHGYRRACTSVRHRGGHPRPRPRRLDPGLPPRGDPRRGPVPRNQAARSPPPTRSASRISGSRQSLNGLPPSIAASNWSSNPSGTATSNAPPATATTPAASSRTTRSRISPRRRRRERAGERPGTRATPRPGRRRRPPGRASRRAASTGWPGWTSRSRRTRRASPR